MNSFNPAGIKRMLSALSLAALCALSPRPALAQVTLNLKDADINALITTVSEVTGKNFIVDPRVKGKVTVISATPMDADSVYETFLAVLETQGFAAVAAGETIKIVPETNVRQEGGGFVGNTPGAVLGDIVTQVFSLQNVSATQLVPILRPLVPQWGLLAAYGSANMLIISDRAGNVARIARIVRQIDQSGDHEIQMVRLEHASASEVVRTVTALKQSSGQSDNLVQPASVIADERSNSVLISGDKTERQKLLDIVLQLDIPLGEGGSTQVVYLRNGDAENLAPILEGYAEQLTQGEAKVQGATGGPGSTPDVRVLADTDTNALIITAPPKQMRQIRDVVTQLDIRRSQVLVEGIVAEVSASKSSQLGVDWAVFNGDRIAAAGILDPSTLSALGTAATDTAAAAASAIGQGVNIAAGVDGGDNGTSFAVLLKALQGDGNTNVLSTPSLTTMDNEEAEFSVGQEVPFLSGSFSNTGSNNGALNPFQTINREEVGLSLKITPQISEGQAAVKLKIELEISSLAAGVSGAVDLVTNKRTLNNTVAVDNGQILVLGGLIDDNVNDTQRSVPLLSSIPLLGNLFRYRSVQRDKRNLMVFIRPTILRDQTQADYYTRRKYDTVRSDQLDAFPGTLPLIGGTKPVMKEYDDYTSEFVPPPEPAEDAKEPASDNAP